LNLYNPSSSEKFLAKPRSETGGGKRFRNSALAECQNRKIFFSLIEKIFAGARLNKCLENFSVLLGGSEADAVRKRWAGLSSCGQQSNLSVGVLFKIGSNFVQKIPPIFRIRILGDCCLALASLGLGKSDDFIRIFEIKKQFLPVQKKVRRAKHGQNEFLQTNLCSFTEGEKQSDNLILVKQI